MKKIEKKQKDPTKEKKKAKIILIGFLVLLLALLIYTIGMFGYVQFKKSKDAKSGKNTITIDCVLTKEPKERPFKQSERVDKLINMQNFYSMRVPYSEDVVTTDNILYEPVSDYQHLIIGQNISLTEYIECLAYIEGVDSSEFEVVDKVEGYFGLEPVTYYLLKAPYGKGNMYTFLYCIYTYDDDGNVITSEYVATLTAEPTYYEDTYALLNEMFDTRVCLDGEHLAVPADDTKTNEPTQDFPGQQITVSANGRINTKYEVDIDLVKDFPYVSLGEDWNYLTVRVYGEKEMFISEILLTDGEQTITDFVNSYDYTTIDTGYGILLIDISSLDLSENSKFKLTLYTEQELNNISLGRVPSSVAKEIRIKGIHAYEAGLDTVSANVVNENIEEDYYDNLPDTYEEELPEPHH